MGKQRILVVDDEPDLVNAVTKILEREGYGVVKAENGEAALKKAREAKPDLILLDLRLPDIDGIQVCRTLRQDNRTRNIPLIMLTVMAKESDKIKGLEIGADDYVTKPFSKGELLARINAIFRRVKRKTSLLETQMAMLKKYIPRHIGEKLLAESEIAAGEKRNVTILVADLSGFTTVAERIDAEQVRELINEYFKVLVDITYKYEGMVDKFFGDGMMALFGLPVVHPDDPERAILAAKEMQIGIGEVNRSKKTKLGLKIGINSGNVVVGNIGTDLRADYTVIGDTVNLAYRLQEQAEPGTILVSAYTHRYCAEKFPFSVPRLISVKGRKQVVEVYKATWGKSS